MSYRSRKGLEWRESEQTMTDFLWTIALNQPSTCEESPASALIQAGAECIPCSQPVMRLSLWPRHTEAELAEKEEQERGRSQPSPSRVKPNPLRTLSLHLCLSLSLFPWIHTCRFTQSITLAVMATLYSHTAGCVIMTVKCSLSLTVDFTSPSTWMVQDPLLHIL